MYIDEDLINRMYHPHKTSSFSNLKVEVHGEFDLTKASKK
jgi:hypothetical protein